MTGNPHQIANKWPRLVEPNGRERHSYITSNETEFHFPACYRCRSFAPGVRQFARAREEVCEQWPPKSRAFAEALAEAQRLCRYRRGKKRTKMSSEK